LQKNADRRFKEGYKIFFMNNATSSDQPGFTNKILVRRKCKRIVDDYYSIKEILSPAYCCIRGMRDIAQDIDNPTEDANLVVPSLTSPYAYDAPFSRNIKEIYGPRNCWADS